MTAEDRDQLVVPMVNPPDPAQLAEERAWLVELEGAPRLRRWAAFLRRGGPGYMQSALTLGGGTAAATLIAGGAYHSDAARARKGRRLAQIFADHGVAT